MRSSYDMYELALEDDYYPFSIKNAVQALTDDLFSNDEAMKKIIKLLEQREYEDAGKYLREMIEDYWYEAIPQTY